MSIFGSINIQQAIDFIIILLISIDIHELAHAIVADRLGDSTPRRMGELSLNPFVHMDQVGIILLLLTSISQYGFTYGRTHVTPTNLKFGPQRGNALVAIAGPISNIILAVIAGLVLSAGLNGTINLQDSILTFLSFAMQLNILLFIFNLIPIPPLDGFSVLGGFLSARQMYALAPLQQWGPLVLLIIFLGEPEFHILSTVVSPAIDHITRVICSNCYA